MDDLIMHKKAVACLIAWGVTFAGFSFVGHTPFSKDCYSKTLDQVTTINPNGKVTYEYKNTNGEDTVVVEYYSKWKKTDECYERSIDYYMPEEYTIESLKEIVEENKEIVPSVHTVEKRNYLTNEELENNESYMKATIIETNKKSVITMESDFDNAVTTSAAIAIFLLSCYGINKGYSRKRKK